MREFHTQRLPSRIRRHRTLIATLAVLLVGGGAFAAAGGTEVVKKLFFDVRVIMLGPDGAKYDAVVKLEAVDGEDGVATGTVDLGDSGEATLEIKQIDASELTGVDVPEGGEMKMMTISLSGSDAAKANAGTEQTIELMAALNTGDQPVEQTQVLEQIADAEVEVPWTDSNDDERAVYLVREVGEDGSSVVKVFGTRWTEDDEEVFDLLGLIRGLDSPILEAPNIDIRGDRVVSVTMVCEDGREVVLRLDRGDPNEGSDAATVNISIDTAEPIVPSRNRD